MTKKDFNQKVNELCNFVKTSQHDDMYDELVKRNIRNGFTYGMWCEKNFEANLREDYKRKTTFTHDFSIAEWCVPMSGMKAIAHTLRSALAWRDNIKYFAELIIAMSMKAWEHDARGNLNYSQMYSTLYLEVKSLYFEWFDTSNAKHDEAMEYYYDYVD